MRRASLSDRHNLCRKEYETEAIVWRGGREGPRAEEVKVQESDQEPSQVLHVRVFVSFSVLIVFARVLDEGSVCDHSCIGSEIVLLCIFCFPMYLPEHLVS